MVELDKLKQEKSETEEARKTAEEQIESMRKDHEEKVIILSLWGVQLKLKHERLQQMGETISDNFRNIA